MNIPQGYKQTELGIIPEDWEIVNLGNVAKVNGRIGFRGYTVADLVGAGQGAYTIGGKHIANMIIDLSDAEYISWEKYYESPEIMVKRGDIVLAQRGSLGKSAIVLNDIGPATINPSLVLINNIKCSNEYLAYWLQSDRIVQYICSINSQTSIPMITQAQIEQIPINIPSSLAEQRAIAEVLSDVDGLIAALDKKIAKKRLLKQGAMQQLFTGKKRLPGFTDEWVDTPIGEGVRFQVGYPFQSQYFTSDRIGKRLVKNRDLKSDDQIVFYNGEYDHKFIVHNGDILIGMDGDFLPYKWDKGIALLNQRVGRLLPTKKWDLSFVMYALIEPLQKLQDGTGATTVKHLSHNDIEQIVLCIPQNYEEQQAIATILSDMDKEIADLEAQRDKYRLLKSGMMQKLLTGQIRLKR